MRGADCRLYAERGTLPDRGAAGPARRGLVYTFNRFQACRFGYGGTLIDPRSHEHCTIAEDMMVTFDRIEQHAIELRADEACRALRADVVAGHNDATALRAAWQATRSPPEVAQGQCERWRS